MAQKPKLPIFGLGLGTIQKWPLAITRGHQTPFPISFPFPIIGPKGCRNLGWRIYGIIYHYALLSLSNSMVTFSRPNYSISSHFPVHQSSPREYFKILKLVINGIIQETIEGNQSPGPSGVGHSNSTVVPQGNTGPGFFEGNFKRLLLIKSVVKA
ncbi:hypothetical protein O181_028621 [Austropuccinia psidii MF-1]|uniref:Uncharacterized protein n=1 Tax=Austropuccinia psidii MF-1 TaxID=1389203 RepID=A0A9Q3H2J6_9BASI|nr:hypothetical protein [Austropuccinia psidii MF-1]